MNRVSRLLHKAVFLSRQQLAIKFSHKYVISNKDTRLAMSASQKPKVTQENDIADKVLKGFDAMSND